VRSELGHYDTEASDRVKRASLISKQSARAKQSQKENLSIRSKASDLPGRASSRSTSHHVAPKPSTAIEHSSRRVKKSQKTSKPTSSKTNLPSKAKTAANKK